MGGFVDKTLEFRRQYKLLSRNSRFVIDDCGAEPPSTREKHGLDGFCSLAPQPRKTDRRILPMIQPFGLSVAGIRYFFVQKYGGINRKMSQMTIILS
jgi:hypothetical protein